MSDAKPNILLITTDQQRFDTIHRHGNSSIFTPHLNWLADSGISFHKCYSDAPICMASRATIMTGRHAHSNRMTGNAADPMPMAEHPTLPGLLTQNGYQTRAIGKMHFFPARAHYGFEHMELLEDYYRQLEREGGPGRPFDHGVGQNEMEPVMATIEESRSLTRWTVERTVDFLDTRDTTRPFFAWTSFSKPHPPWDCDPKYWALYDGIDMPPAIHGDWSKSPDDVPHSIMAATRRYNGVDAFSPKQLAAARRAYYACISQIDYNLGYLFGRMRELGLLENTWIIFTSDHGELLGDHWLGAKCNFLEGSSHVPMIVRPAAPEVFASDRASTSSDALTCLADVMPTCLSIAGIDRPGAVDGIDLLSAAAGDESRERILGQQQSYFAVIEKKFKYHFCAEDGAELLFDIENDPLEQRELIRTGEYQHVLSEMRSQMTTLLQNVMPDAVKDGNPRGLRDDATDVVSRGSRFPGTRSRRSPNDLLH